MRHKNDSGFVLIETAFLLFIISMMTLIPVLSIDKMIASAQIDAFFRELSSNITLMQNHAILNNERTDIQFVKGKEGAEDIIEFKVNGYADHPLNRRMSVDSPYYAYGTGKYFGFHFKKGTGNISISNTVEFDTVKGRYTLTYWLGSGRFEIAPSTF